MTDRFFDTSAVAKHYHEEEGSAIVDGFLGEAGSFHFISELTVVELLSVLARLVRTGIISADAFHLSRSRFLADIAGGSWQVLPLFSTHYHQAQLLVGRHGLVRSIHTLDALQLAVALDHHATRPLGAFVCADGNLCKATTAEGLVVVDPEAA